MVPVADTLNCEVELVWKSRKLPANEVGLIPIYVPEAELPFWIMLGPRRRSDELAVASGLAEKIPDDEKVARPEMLAVVPTVRKPDAERLVAEADPKVI